MRSWSSSFWLSRPANSRRMNWHPGSGTGWRRSIRTTDAASPAGRILDDPDRPQTCAEAVEDVELARRIGAEAGDGADRLHRRPASGEAGERAEHAQLGAAVAILGIEGVADEAAIAGLVRLPAAKGADLRLELADRRGDERDPRCRGAVGNREPGREIDAAVEDEVGAVEELRHIVRPEPLRDAGETDLRIEPGDDGAG